MFDREDLISFPFTFYPPQNRLVAAFHTAAKAGDTATLSKLLDSSASSQLFTLLLNARERKSGRTALHTACRAGVPTSLAWLLDKGASVLVTDTYVCHVHLRGCFYVKKDCA